MADVPSASLSRSEPTWPCPACSAPLTISYVPWAGPCPRCSCPVMWLVGPMRTGGASRSFRVAAPKPWPALAGTRHPLVRLSAAPGADVALGVFARRGDWRVGVLAARAHAQASTPARAAWGRAFSGAAPIALVVYLVAAALFGEHAPFWRWLAVGIAWGIAAIGMRRWVAEPARLDASRAEAAARAYGPASAYCFARERLKACNTRHRARLARRKELEAAAALGSAIAGGEALLARAAALFDRIEAAEAPLRARLEELAERASLELAAAGALEALEADGDELALGHVAGELRAVEDALERQADLAAARAELDALLGPRSGS